MPRNEDDDDDDHRPRRRDEDDDRPRRRRDEDNDDRPRSRSRRREGDDDYDDRPRRRRPQGNPPAATSLTLGLLSILLNVLTGIPAIIFGVIGLKRAGQYGPGRAMAVSGIISGVVGILLSSLGIYFFWNSTNERQTNNRMRNNAKLLGIAMHAHHDTTASFPRAYTTPAGGAFFLGKDPPPVDRRLMSWRTAVLPYVEQAPLFQQYDQLQPWNGPRNQATTSAIVSAYLTDEPPTNQTRFRVFTGPNTPFPHDRMRLRMTEFTDGTSNTFLIVESADSGPWGEPRDIEVSPNVPVPQLGSPQKNTFLVLMADGSVRSMNKTVNEQVMRWFIDPADGMVVPNEAFR